MKYSIVFLIVNVLQYVMAGIETNEVYQLIELILSIITSVVLLALRIWAWYKDAKKDGKITSKEIEKLYKDVDETSQEIKKEIDDNKNKPSK